MIDYKNYFKKHLIGVLSLTLISACAPHRHEKAQEALEKSGPQNSDAQAKILGTWKSGCSQFSIGDFQSTTLVVKTDTSNFLAISKVVNSFETSALCQSGQTPNYTQDYSMLSSVTGTSPLVLRSYYLDIFLTPHRGYAATFELIDYCGISSWQDETPESVGGFVCVDITFPDYETEYTSNVTLSGTTLTLDNVTFNKVN